MNTVFNFFQGPVIPDKIPDDVAPLEVSGSALDAIRHHLHHGKNTFVELADGTTLVGRCELEKKGVTIGSSDVIPRRLIVSAREV